MFVSIHSIVVYFPQSSVYAVIVAVLMFCYFLNGSWVCGDPVYVQICNPTIPVDDPPRRDMYTWTSLSS